MPEDAAAAAGLLLLGLLLCFISSGLVAQWKDSSARHQEPGVEGILGAVAGAAGTGIVAWWLFSLACASATALLARKGRTQAAAATGKLSPAFMQRLVLGVLSVQLLSGPVAHGSVPAPGPEWAPTQGQASPAPGMAGAVAVAEATAAASEENPPNEAFDGTNTPVPLGKEHPVTEAAPLPAAVYPGWQPAPPVVNPGMLAAPAARAPSDTAAAGVEGVTVQAGDTLWDIAARHLGDGVSDADVALQWPRWYQANLALIGQSPDVLLPGQVLQPPSSGQT